MEGFNCKGFYSFPNVDSSSGLTPFLGLCIPGTVPLPLLSLLKEQCNSTQNWLKEIRKAPSKKFLAKEKFELQVMPLSGTLHYFKFLKYFQYCLIIQQSIILSTCSTGCY